MAPPAAASAASDGVHTSLLSAGAQLIPEGSRRHAAAATLELQTAAAAKAASAGRSINRITLGNIESLNEVYIGLCATVVMVGLIMMVCMPIFDGATVTWLRSWEPLRGPEMQIGILGPYRRAVLEKYKSPGDAFADMDRDHSGALDLSEFTDGTALFDYTMDETTAQRLFEHMDTDQDDLLDPASFETWMAVPGMRKPDYLVSPASAGTTTIEVEGEAMASYKVNDKIRLTGTGGAEEVVIVTGFGEYGGVVVSPPLEYNYETGDRVEFVESTTTKRTTTTFTTTTKTTTTFTTTTFKDPAVQIRMTIDKGDSTDPLGADLSKGDGFVLVSGVTGGVIQQWNNDHPDQALKPGDKIVEVNGIRIADQISEEVAQSNILKLVIKRGPPKAAARRLMEMASSFFV